MNYDSKEYLLLLSPIVLGLGSTAFIDNKKIPKTQVVPAWLFGIVWPILYLLLGYSSVLIYQSGIGRKYLNYYFIHLLCLLIWWPLFVYYPNHFYSTFTLFLLACSAVVIAQFYKKINIVAAYCLVPYICWLFFATYLSYLQKN
jgi:tryptophan-rich sensory protein